MKVNSLEDIQKLKEQLKSTKEQIKKYSFYNMDDIAEAIVKVISSFEGIEYISIRYRFNLDENIVYNSINLERPVGLEYPAIHIIPKRKESEEYARYRLMYKRDQDDKNICYLPPSYYTPYKKCYYMKDFINYLYIKKVENDVINDRDFYLKVAAEFIENTKTEQQERQNMIEQEYQKKLGPMTTKNELMWHRMHI